MERGDQIDPSPEASSAQTSDIVSISLSSVVAGLVIILLIVLLVKYRSRLNCIKRKDSVQRRGTRYQGIRLRSLVPSIFVLSGEESREKRSARLSKVNGLNEYYSQLSIARELSVEEMPDIDLSRSDSFAVSFASRTRQE